VQDVSLLTAMNVKIIIFGHVTTFLICNIYTDVSNAHSEGECQSNPSTEIKMGY
jgi:hypothetical protein